MQDNHYDIVLIGSGIMSATLGVLLHEINPSYKILLIERLDSLAQESSDAMNNAGTGHSAFCELNYTPQKSDGSIDISKALVIAEQFEISKQFWSRLINLGYMSDAKSFINQTPHCSLVFGDDVQYLKKRYEALIQNHLFEGMQYSDNYEEIATRMPLVTTGRSPAEKLAATYMSIGTDVNFGALARQMITHLVEKNAMTLLSGYDVKNITQNANKTIGKTTEKIWTISAISHSSEKFTCSASFVFLGAGGGALPLLQKSGITERKQFGGFPVSGQWLVCNNPEIVEQHATKVYGKASVGTPPMSVPHLDTRIINGKKTLLFGPYAGFTTKFLKKGSFLDLFKSLRVYNIWTMLQAGVKNIDLTKYLIGQVVQSRKDRLQALRMYMPEARAEDWALKEAGYRVQVIKHDSQQGGILQFGTEIVVAADKTLATLLGASPGASTAVSAMIQIIEKCFPDHATKLSTLIPTYGQSLSKDRELAQKTRAWTHEILGIRTER